MTVQTSNSVATFAGNGVTTVFPIGFKFNSAADLVVLLIDDASGAELPLTLNSSYTVSGAGDDAGGSVTVIAAPATGQTLKVSRVVDILQLTDLRNQGKFFAETHEDALDLLTMIDQQQQVQVDEASATADAALTTAAEMVDRQDAFELSAGYQDLGTYAGGLVITARNQVVLYSGEYYRLAAGAAVPYTLTGTWATDSAYLVGVGDAVLRQDLTTADGADMVGYKGRTVADKLGDVANIMDYGAAADGVTDDAPALRAAMAALVAKGGGHLYIPAGTYYLNSGDPRGLSLLPITGVSDWYTVCEIGDGVTVYGDGAETVLLYESNRAGEFLVADGVGVFRATAAALFANFAVRENSTTAYTVSSFHVRDFSVVYTALTNQAKDLIDGQVVRIYSNAGAIRNGTFSATNIDVSDCPGHQVFSYERVAAFYGIHNRFYLPGFASNQANTDHSTFYVTGTLAEYDGNICFGAEPDFNSTFIESHCTYNHVHGNTCSGMNVFCNAVSQVSHPAPEYDFSQFIVSGNIIRGCRTLVADFCYSQNHKAVIDISDNIAFLSADALTSAEAIIKLADSGVDQSLMLPTDLITIRNNNIYTIASVSGEIDYNTSFSALVDQPKARNIVFEGNRISSARRAVLNISGTTVESVKVRNNTLLNVGFAGNSAFDANARVSRCAAVVTLIPGAALTDVAFINNTFTVGYSGAAPSYGVLIANYFGANAPARFDIRGNAISGPNTLDIFTDSQGGNTHAVGVLSIDHEHSIFSGGDSYLNLATVGALPEAVRAGSEGRFFGVSARATGTSVKITAQGTAAPISGYWTLGSVVENNSPAPSGYMGWVCTTAGTPGTWKTFGAIAA